MNGSEVFPAVFRLPFLDSPDYNKLLSDLSKRLFHDLALFVSVAISYECS